MNKRQFLKSAAIAGLLCGNSTLFAQTPKELSKFVMTGTDVDGQAFNLAHYTGYTILISFLLVVVASVVAT